MLWYLARLVAYLTVMLFGFAVFRLVLWPWWRFRALSGLPGPRALPFVGTLYRMWGVGDILQDMIVPMVTQYERLWVVWRGWAPVVVVGHPEPMRQVLTSSTLTRKASIYDTLLPWLGNGLLLSYGDEWYRSRRMLTHAFHFAILRHAMDIFQSHATVFLEVLDAQATNPGEPTREFDIAPFITRATLEVICEAAMACDLDIQRHPSHPYLEGVQRAADLVFRRILSPWFQGPLGDHMYRLFGDGKEHDQIIQTLHDFTDGVIAQRREAHAKGEVSTVGDTNRLVFLDLLLSATDAETGEPLTDAEVRAQTDTFMFEGFDTTGSGITSTIYLLASHPQVQQHLQQELDDVLGDRPFPSDDDLASLPYLSAVIRESLRLLPPVPFISRIVEEEGFTLDGHELPVGTTISLNIYAAHHNPHIWEDPESFRPDRFLDDVSRDPFVHVPFSAGKRNCIGRKFAERELHVMIATIFKAFQVSVDPALDPRFVPYLVIRPKHGLPVSLVRRSPSP